MRRRTYVRCAAGGSIAGLAGCFTTDDPEPEPEREEEEPVDAEADGTLRIATYESMVTGDDPAGAWLAERFAESFPDAELEWTVPDSGIDHFVQRYRRDAEIDADVYLGLTVGDLVLADGRGASRLFDSIDVDRLEHADRVRDDLAVDDPDDRIVPVATGEVALVYDETTIRPPATLEALLADEYADAVLAEDPRYSLPGRAFLCWTVAEYGDEFADYWADLSASGLEVADSWTDAYVDRYLEGEGSVVVSYTTDPVAAASSDRAPERHRVATPEGRAIGSTEGVGIFAGTENVDLAHEFVDFVLSRDAQSAIAARNYQFPAVEDPYVDRPDAFDAAADPEETIAVTYDDLSGSLDDWLTEWEAVLAP
ncbi:thiamine ABC transporter substrate-binding protein [Halopiger goleimassiliensis]|uniref:thiamine ABC transporter substrate-binding protein n=1 Tax=Halopiger goleimassiliensis TaxID=1293048 RepID=UPI00067801C4|nr:thiamine ABC transporter substrate-binding protein [Halopiger goleimassiliensis]